MVKAQLNLGVMYNKGEGVAEDKREAAHWYRAAADNGDMRAQFILGLIYALGKGVMQDAHEAYVWFLIAKSSGVEEAEKELQRADWPDLLTPEQIKSAEQEARKRFGEIEKRRRKQSEE